MIFTAVLSLIVCTFEQPFCISFFANESGEFTNTGLFIRPSRTVTDPRPQRWNHRALQTVIRVQIRSGSCFLLVSGFLSASPLVKRQHSSGAFIRLLTNSADILEDPYETFQREREWEGEGEKERVMQSSEGMVWKRGATESEKRRQTSKSEVWKFISGLEGRQLQLSNSSTARSK